MAKLIFMLDKYPIGQFQTWEVISETPKQYKAKCRDGWTQRINKSHKDLRETWEEAIKAMNFNLLRNIDRCERQTEKYRDALANIEKNNPKPSEVK